MLGLSYAHRERGGRRGILPVWSMGRPLSPLTRLCGSPRCSAPRRRSGWACRRSTTFERAQDEIGGRLKKITPIIDAA